MKKIVKSQKMFLSFLMIVVLFISIIPLKAEAAGRGGWRLDANGWWYQIPSGGYPANQWYPVGDKWYYFDRFGYMESDQYVQGYWLNNSGDWNEIYSGGRWYHDGNGWRYTDNTGWEPYNRWLKIDDYWYYFYGDGYMASDTWIDGWYVGSSGAWGEDLTPVYGDFPAYRIEVNKRLNFLTVYGGQTTEEANIPVKAVKISTGKNSSTGTGTFYTSDQYRWRLMEDDVWAQYATRVYGHVLFHSVPYYKANQNTLKTGQYNLLGHEASKGCIRMSAENARWIYYHCLPGTRVDIYDSYDHGPLGCGSSLVISSNTHRDPTDIW